MWIRSNAVVWRRLCQLIGRTRHINIPLEAAPSQTGTITVLGSRRLRVYSYYLPFFGRFTMFGPAGGLRIIVCEGLKVDDAWKRQFCLLFCARWLSTPLEDPYRGADSHRGAKDLLRAQYRQRAQSASLACIGSQLNRHGANPHTRVTVEDLNPVDIIAVMDSPLYRWGHLYRELLYSTLAWHDKLSESRMPYQRFTV